VLVVLWGGTPVTDFAGEQCYTTMTLIYPGPRPPSVPQTQTIPLLTSVATPDQP